MKTLRLKTDVQFYWGWQRSKATAPRGTPVIAATNLPDDPEKGLQYWVEPWEGVDQNGSLADWINTYGVLVDRDQVALTEA